MSVKQIRKLVETGQPVSIDFEELGTSYKNSSFKDEFVNYCAAVLVRLGLKVQLSKKDKFIAVLGDPPFVLPGEKLFPPLTFVPMPGRAHFRSKYGFFLNRNHPFSEWLMGKATIIRQLYPGIFRSLREHVFCQDPVTACAEINGNLKRLALLHQDVQPPAHVFLTLKDFPKFPHSKFLIEF